MINHIQVTTVFVTDQNKARDFYVNKLGLTLKIDMPEFRWLEVVPAKGETSLSLMLPFPGMPSSVVGGSKGIIFDTSDVNKAHTELSSKGVEFTQPPTNQPWGGIEARFKDPDGNEFALVQRTQ